MQLCEPCPCLGVDAEKRGDYWLGLGTGRKEVKFRVKETGQVIN